MTIMMKRAMTFLLVVLSGSVQASDCDEGQDSMEAIRRCLGEASNVEMQKAYRSVLTTLTTDEARRELRASQVTFIEYRNQSCSAVSEASKQYGWVADDYTTNCVTHMNSQRQKFLVGIVGTD